MYKSIKSAVLACSIAFAPTAHAMDFRLAYTKEVTILYMNGDINLGDEVHLREYLNSYDTGPDPRPLGIIITSDGGNAGEAFRLADDIRNRTVVVKGTCASACFYIFAAAKVRAVADGAHVGVHSVAVIPGHPEVNAGAVNAEVVTKMRTMGVPDDVCMDMLTTSNDSIHWLSRDQLARMHATVQ